jgi:restriction endonuclease S subunit
LNGVPLLRISDLKDIWINVDDLVFIPEELSNKYKRYIVTGGDIVVSQRGTIGLFSEITNDFKKYNISANLIAIKKSNEVNFRYLLIFLNSKYGISQLKRSISGQVQPKITTDNIKNIKVFIPSQSFQHKIEEMVKEAQEKRRSADEKYKEAEEILSKELGFGDLYLSTQKTFETKFSETNERIDPEHYQPIFNEVEQVFNKQKTVNLGDINLEIKYGTSEDLFYVEKGIPFLRVTDINKFSTIEPMEGKFINNFNAERLKGYQVKTDDIIISRTGTLGLAVYIDEKLDGAIYGSYFIKVKPRHKNLYNRFIAFFISSEIGRLQTNRWAGGGIQTNLTIDAIKSIRIPILSWPIQQRICSLIQDSLKLREETENLLNEAKQKVEKMVLGE